MLIGIAHAKCITDSPTPSAKTSRCQILHNLRPHLRNSTVYLFSPEKKYLKTCYPSFLSATTKGWCATRPPGDFDDQIPTADSGWGFCSNDISQEGCNSRILDSQEDDTPYKLSFLEDQFCFQELKENLKVEQPKELKDRFEEKVDSSQTFCVGQFFNHSFDNQHFVMILNQTYTTLNRSPELEVNKP